jgi:hypothetical protein
VPEDLASLLRPLIGVCVCVTGFRQFKNVRWRSIIMYASEGIILSNDRSRMLLPM